MQSKYLSILLFFLLAACSPLPEAGFYLKTDGVVEIALISPRKIAFQAFFKNKGTVKYLSGKADLTSDGEYQYQGEHGPMRFTFTNGRISIHANSLSQEARYFTGTYDYVNPAYQLPKAYYTYQARFRKIIGVDSWISQ